MFKKSYLLNLSRQYENLQIILYRVQLMFQYKLQQMEEYESFRNRSSILYHSSEQLKKQCKQQRFIQQEMHSLQASKGRFLNFCQQLGTLKETNLLNSVVKYASNGFKKSHPDFSNLNFENIIRLIDNRIQKMRKTKVLKRNWGQQDLTILIWLVSKYCQFKKIKHHDKQLNIQDWSFIATLIPGVSTDSCMFKWLSLKTVSLTKCNWTVQQSQILKKIVNARMPYKTKHCSEIKDWRQISKELYNLNKDDNKHYRNPKQCKEHWTCYLSNNCKKGPWTIQQDIKLFNFIYKNKGGRKWSQMVKHFDNRTQNALKNRYTLLLQKLKKKYQKQYSQIQLIKLFIQQNYINQFTTQNIAYQDEQMQYSQCKKEESYFYQCFKVDGHLQQQKNGKDNKIEVKFMDMSKLQQLSCDFLLGLKPGFLDTNGSFTKIEKEHQFNLFGSENDEDQQQYSNDFMFQSN